MIVYCNPPIEDLTFKHNININVNNTLVHPNTRAYTNIFWKKMLLEYVNNTFNQGFFYIYNTHYLSTLLHITNFPILFFKKHTINNYNVITGTGKLRLSIKKQNKFIYEPSPSYPSALAYIASKDYFKYFYNAFKHLGSIVIPYN